MPETSSIYNETFQVRSYDVRTDGSAKLSSICNYLQEAAGNHAHELNYDIEQLRGTNRTWVLYRLNLEMNQYPRWGDHVTIETWPSGGEGVLAYRDFMLVDQKKGILGRGISQWMILNLETRRPMRIPEKVIQMQIDKRRHMLSPKREKISIPEENGAETELSFRIRRNDLDLNGHVNNVSYINWLTESVPRNIYHRHHLSYLDIIFQAESQLEDRITSRCFIDSSEKNAFFHKIVRSNDQATLSSARSVWSLVIDQPNGRT